MNRLDCAGMCYTLRASGESPRGSIIWMSRTNQGLRPRNRPRHLSAKAIFIILMGFSEPDDVPMHHSIGRSCHDFEGVLQSVGIRGLNLRLQ